VEFAAKAARSNEAADRALRDARGGRWRISGRARFAARHRRGRFRQPRAGRLFRRQSNGLFDMVGNVWEWTADRYGAPRAAGGLSLQPVFPRGAPAQVIKGGSFLCSADYCVRARALCASRRMRNLPGAHVGFRTMAAAN